MKHCTSTLSSKKPRILLSAYACSPYRGSEAAVGWNIATRLGQYCEVTVLYASKDCEIDYRSEIERYVAESGPTPGVTFVPVEHNARGRFYSTLHDRGLWLAYYLAYREWQLEAYRVATALHRDDPFSLVHHLTYNGFREPGFLWKLPVPFAWGPVGGLMCFPWRYRRILTKRDQVFHAFRNISTYLQLRLSSRVRQAARRAKLLWTITSEERRLAAAYWQVDAGQMLETGTRPDGASLAHRDDADNRAGIHLCWSGVHEGRKALPLLLEALHLLKGKLQFRLTILGDGRATPAWRALADRLGLTDEIDWAGRLPHGQAVQRMATADCLIFTSLMEGTPHVVLEALSCGLPVVCHDCCGMAEVVTSSCGIRVPVATADTSVRDFAVAIETLSKDRAFLRTLSSGALARSGQLSWDDKAKQIAEEYASLLEESECLVQSA